jgi:hypothetical protein
MGHAELPDLVVVPDESERGRLRLWTRLSGSIEVVVGPSS